MLAKLAARDLSVIALTLALWALDASLRGSESLGAIGVALLVGMLTALSGYLVHEWGHLLGALGSGAVVHLPKRVLTVFLFNFDTGRNSRRQFMSMSYGGFAASTLTVILLVFTLPFDALSGWAAMTLVVAGVIATFILEVPVAWRVAHGASFPSGSAYQSTGEV